MSNSLRELRFFAQAGGEATWEMIFWSLALRNLPAEVYFTPLQIHWCREHRDFDDVRVAGPERLGRAHRPTTLMLPS